MRIGDRAIGVGEPVYVIAEIGVNHDGSVERALELTDAAAATGADAVKLQLFETDRLMSRAAKLAAYQARAGETDPVSMLRRLELGLDEMHRVVERARVNGLHAIVTVFSLELVEPAMSLGWDAYKIASPDIIHRPLLEAVSRVGRPMIVSTGASTLDEVSRARGWLHGVSDRLAFLQCVSAYPAPASALGGIGAVGACVGVPVGYSDHTPGIETGAKAVRAGAVLLEKHLTYDTGAAGPDHAASLAPASFGEYVRLAKIETTVPASHEGEKVLATAELEVRRVSRQSIVAAANLPAGHRLTMSDLTIKRPGTGLKPWRLDEILGCSLRRAVESDCPIDQAWIDEVSTQAPSSAA
ncbi:MAG: N-acetylneuraminate synthase family protein [Planctomycetota bacterium]